MATSPNVDQCWQLGGPLVVPLMDQKWPTDGLHTGHLIVFQKCLFILKCIGNHHVLHFGNHIVVQLRSEATAPSEKDMTPKCDVARVIAR